MFSSNPTFKRSNQVSLCFTDIENERTNDAMIMMKVINIING